MSAGEAHGISGLRERHKGNALCHSQSFRRFASSPLRRARDNR